MRTICRAALSAAFLFSHASFAQTADIKVFSTVGVQAALQELTPKIEKATGRKLAINWGNTASLVKRVHGGEMADMLILSREALGDLAKDSKAIAEPGAVFASSRMVVIVKSGSRTPDISTPEAFKQALLAAKSVAYSDPAAGGASAAYFAKLIERLGIVDEMKAKTRHPLAPLNAASLVVSGDAELAVQQEPEVVSVFGVDLVRNLPAEFSNVVAYAAGIGAGSKEAATVKAVIAYLHSPEAAVIFKAKRLDPE
jgi:molybdate transport system substrate-binding protein